MGHPGFLRDNTWWPDKREKLLAIELVASFLGDAEASPIDEATSSWCGRLRVQP